MVCLQGERGREGVRRVWGLGQQLLRGTRCFHWGSVILYGVPFFFCISLIPDLQGLLGGIQSPRLLLSRDPTVPSVPGGFLFTGNGKMSSLAAQGVITMQRQPVQMASVAQGTARHETHLGVSPLRSSKHTCCAKKNVRQASADVQCWAVNWMMRE